MLPYHPKQCITDFNFFFFLQIFKILFRTPIFHSDKRMCSYSKSIRTAYHYYTHHKEELDNKARLHICYSELWNTSPFYAAKCSLTGRDLKWKIRQTVEHRAYVESAASQKPIQEQVTIASTQNRLAVFYKGLHQLCPIL